MYWETSTLTDVLPLILWILLMMFMLGSFPFEVLSSVVEVDFLWNRTVDLLKISFHPLLWTSSGLRDS